MRLGLAALAMLCSTCSLVVSDRTPAYEGACASEEEAATSRYNQQGEPAQGVGSRGILNIALTCDPCATEDCVEECIGIEIHHAITLECSACFADAADCVKDSCLAPCTGDLLDIDECNRCLCSSHCGDELNGCAGLTLVTCRE